MKMGENTERLRRKVCVGGAVKGAYEMVSNFSVKEGAWNLYTNKRSEGLSTKFIYNKMTGCVKASNNSDT